MNTYPVTYGSNVNNNNTTKFSIIFFTDTIIINCAYVYTLIWVKRCPIFVESIQFLSQWHCHIDNQVHCHYYYKISWSGTVLYYWYCNRVLEYRYRYKPQLLSIVQLLYVLASAPHDYRWLNPGVRVKNSGQSVCSQKGSSDVGGFPGY